MSTEKTGRPLAPPPLEHHWRCRFCGLLARSLPVSGSRWVDILVHDYRPYAVQVCPECWSIMAGAFQDQIEHVELTREGALITFPEAAEAKLAEVREFCSNDPRTVASLVAADVLDIINRGRET